MSLGVHADAHKQFPSNSPWATDSLPCPAALDLQSSLNPLPTLAFSMPLETLPRQHGRPWPVPLSSRPLCGCGHWSGPHEEPGHKTVSVTSLQFALDTGKSGLKRVANLKKRSKTSIIPCMKYLHCLTWVRLQQPQEQCYPFPPMCAVSVRAQTMVRLSMFGILNVDARACAKGPYENCKSLH